MTVTEKPLVDIQAVVIRASPNGLTDLSRLLSALPNPTPVPIVVALPQPASELTELAARIEAETARPTSVVTGHHDLAPGVVHLVSTGRPATIVSPDQIDVDNDGDPLATPSSNALFESAARVFADRLVGVVLRDAGIDGASSALLVKEAGGTVIVQTIAGTSTSSPALEPTTVDVSAPIDLIGDLVADMLTAPARPEDATNLALLDLLDDIQARHGIDFSSYKRTTLLRRLDRRMAAVGMSRIEEYRRYLRSHPEEGHRLISGFLIKVTRFFRDPGLYDYLRDTVLPAIIGQAIQEQRELRIWSAGCGTGEEAYSLAMLIHELIDDRSRVPIRIFATDLDEEAIAFARRGVYPAAALGALRPELRAKYFSDHDGMYEVQKSIRGLLIFGRHDLGERPPFPNIDLVVCRNVMIYFTAELQRQILDGFAYSLRDDGYLVLGAAETTHPAGDRFALDDRQHRVYRRTGPRPRLLRPWPRRSEALAEATGPLSRSRSLADATAGVIGNEAVRDQTTPIRFENLLRQLPVGLALIDAHYDIELINGPARQLLGIHGTAVGQDFIHLAERVPSTPLRSAIDQVLRGDGPGRVEDVVTTESATGDVMHLSLSCHAVRSQPDGRPDSVLIVVQDMTETTASRDGLSQTNDRLRAEISELRATADRLAAGNRTLLAANRELSDTNDDLREQSEEFRIANAASQVAAEEIETLNEEFQATNEELETLNEETQATVEELNATNDELTARSLQLENLAETNAAERARLAVILASLGDVVIVVDANAAPVLTNAAYDALVDSLGRPLIPADVNGVPLPREQTPQARAARGERFLAEFTVPGAERSQRWFEATGSPLRGEEHGGVLVLREITDRRLRDLEEQFLHVAGHELRSPLTALQGYLQLAQRRASRGDDERLVRHIDLALAQVQRQSALINQLMDVGRLRNGKLSVTLEPTDLVPLLEHVIDTMRVITPNLTFTFAADRERIMVMGDALRIEQIAINLITNAATHARGTRIAVHAGQSADAAEFRVEDDGVGISQDQMQHIFERLTQVARPAPDNAGLGLGLYIAREIAQAHNGSITVDSAVGEGTTFTVRLPLAVVERDAEGETEPVS